MATFKVRRYSSESKIPSEKADGTLHFVRDTGHAFLDYPDGSRVPLKGASQTKQDLDPNSVANSSDSNYGIRYKFTSSSSSDVPSDDKFTTEAAVAKRFTYSASGVSSSVPITTLGWKRVAILSRKMSGIIALCFEANKAAAGLIRHNLVLSFEGATEFPSSTANDNEARYPGQSSPRLSVVSSSISGENQDAVTPMRRLRIASVRIAYPSYNKADSDSGKYPSTTSGPVACYLDVLIACGDPDYIVPSGGYGSSSLSVNIQADTLTSVDGDQYSLLTDKECSATGVGVKGESLDLSYSLLIDERYNSYIKDGTQFVSNARFNEVKSGKYLKEVSYQVFANSDLWNAGTKRFNKISQIHSYITKDLINDPSVAFLQVGLLNSRNLITWSNNMYQNSSSFTKHFRIDIDAGTLTTIDQTPAASSSGSQYLIYDSRGLVRTTTSNTSTGFDCAPIILKAHRTYRIQDCRVVVLPKSKFSEVVSDVSYFLSTAANNIPDTSIIYAYNKDLPDADYSRLVVEYTPTEDMVVLQAGIVVLNNRPVPANRTFVPAISEKDTKVGKFSRCVRVPIYLDPDQSEISIHFRDDLDADNPEEAIQLHRLFSEFEFHDVSAFVFCDGFEIQSIDPFIAVVVSNESIDEIAEEDVTVKSSSYFAHKIKDAVIPYSKLNTIKANNNYKVEYIKRESVDVDIGNSDDENFEGIVKGIVSGINKNLLIKGPGNDSATNSYYSINYENGTNAYSVTKIADGTRTSAQVLAIFSTSSYASGVRYPVIPILLREGQEYTFMDVQARVCSLSSFLSATQVPNYNWSGIEAALAESGKIFSGVCAVGSGRDYSWTQQRNDPSCTNHVKYYTPEVDEVILLARFNIAANHTADDLVNGLNARTYNDNDTGESKPFPYFTPCVLLGHYTWDDIVNYHRIKNPKDLVQIDNSGLFHQGQYEDIGYFKYHATVDHESKSVDYKDLLGLPAVDNLALQGVDLDNMYFYLSTYPSRDVLEAFSAQSTTTHTAVADIVKQETVL